MKSIWPVSFPGDPIWKAKERSNALTIIDRFYTKLFSTSQVLCIIYHTVHCNYTQCPGSAEKSARKVTCPWLVEKSAEIRCPWLVEKSALNSASSKVCSSIYRHIINMFVNIWRKDNKWSNHQHTHSKNYLLYVKYNIIVAILSF